MTLPGFLTRNLRLKAVATTLSVLTWGAVVYASNPPQTRTVNVHVPQDASAIPSQYVLLKPISDLAVRVSGTKEHLDAFDPASLSVAVNYNAIHHAGTVALPVSVGNRDPDVEIDSVPTTVGVSVDTLMSASKPVDLIVNPPPPRGYIPAAHTLKPDVVVVTGPSHELGELTATVTVDMSQQKANFQGQEAVLLTVRGKKVNDVGVTPPTVEVDITVSPSRTSRVTAVIPRPRDQVASGHQLTSITVDPPTVTLSGPQEILNTLDSIPTANFSLSGLTGDHTFATPLSVPHGVDVTPSQVTVHVSVATTPSAPSPSPGPTASPSPT